MPKLEVGWHGNSLQIKAGDLSSVFSDRSGILKRSRLSVATNDVNLVDIDGFELFFQSREGMSGGPVIDDDSGEVVGMLSMGLPRDVPIKTQTFAISMQEIVRRLRPTK
jgi:hypothetical protein